MLYDVLKKFVRWADKSIDNSINKNKDSKEEIESGTQENDNSQNSQKISEDLNQNLTMIKAYFEKTNDIVIREIELGTKQPVKAFLVMIDGLVDKTAINESFLKSLMVSTRMEDSEAILDKGNIYHFVKNCVLSVAQVEETDLIENAVNSVLSGDAALFIDGTASSIVTSIRGWASRGVTEPETESVIRGPREGFVETIRINTSMLRRKIKSHNLKFETLVIGKQTNTNVCIAYMKNIADDKIVEEVRKRLRNIDTDSILESGYIESFIEDGTFSIFPTIGVSEKPDIVSAKLLEGRVAVLVDGTPFVLTVPFMFVEGFQTSEDYYVRPFFASLVRLLRYSAFFIAVFLPALYVAITSYHQELLPPELLTTIAASEEGTPFPVLVEALVMQVIFEILREAGVRLPKVVGSAVSIVGALVIGEAAVTAGLIGAPMVIIIALTAVSSFVITPYYDAIAIMRLILLSFAGIGGFYGIMIGFVWGATHFCALTSFGVPYISPLVPFKSSDMKDVFIRVPWWSMISRPRIIGKKNPTRQKPNAKLRNLPGGGKSDG